MKRYLFLLAVIGLLAACDRPCAITYGAGDPIPCFSR